MYSLALGGGGARGFIHLGVLKYLEEQNIKITELAGTSMGAIIAAFIATGKDYSYIYNFFTKKLKYLSLLDFDFKMGLLKGKKLERVFRKEFGNIQIQDCRIPLKIVATNIENGSICVFTSGDLVNAIRASISLPGIFIPKKINSVDYVDGGILMNLPIQALDGKKVIAVSALRVEKGKIQTTKKILGIEIKSGFFKNNFRILFRSLSLLMKANEDISLANNSKEIHFIRPNFGNLHMLDFDKIDKFIQIGYNEAKKKLIFSKC